VDFYGRGDKEEGMNNRKRCGLADANGYFLELENAETEAALQVDLPTTATSFAVPDGLLLPNTEYELSIGVIGANGNRVFTEISFTTGS
jgi:hypothetical protein